MPYTLRPNKFFAKDPNGDGYLPQNVIAGGSSEGSTEEMQALIDASIGVKYSTAQSVTGPSGEVGLSITASVSANTDVTLAVVADSSVEITGGSFNLGGEVHPFTIGENNKVVYFADTLGSDLTNVTATVSYTGSGSIRFVLATGLRSEILKQEAILAQLTNE